MDATARYLGIINFKKIITAKTKHNNLFCGKDAGSALNEEILQTNLRRAGEFFIHSLWIQSQMVDLIILNQKPEIHDSFVDNPEQIPEPMVVARADYWTKMTCPHNMYQPL